MPGKKKRTLTQFKTNRKGVVSTRKITEKAKARKLKRGKAAAYLSGNTLSTSFQGYKSSKI
jgi:hypothetical protein